MNKTAIITVTQGDWQYLEEWIEYHRSIGIDLFLIAYNGPIEEMNRLPKYDYVKYYDYATDDKDPMRSYMNYSDGKGFSGWIGEYEREYNGLIMQKIENQLLRELLYFFPQITYCCVIDTDEFLSINNNKINNITKCLDKNFPVDNSSIQVQMRFYDDNDQIYNSYKPVRERFTRKQPVMSVKIKPGFGKMIINLKHEHVCNGEIHLYSPHTCTKYIRDFIIDINELELNHYWTKSLEEWISKFSNTVDRDYFKRFHNDMFGQFFQWNRITPQKLIAIPELLKKYNIDYNPLNEKNKIFVEQYKKYNGLD